MFFSKKLTFNLGIADAGHYYSLIEDRYNNHDGSSTERRWLEFNDAQVHKFDIKNMPSEAYGFPEHHTSSSSTRQSSIPLKNAYLLFYDRVYFQNEPEEEEQKKREEEKKKFDSMNIEENHKNENDHSASLATELEHQETLEPLTEEIKKRKKSEMILMRDILLDERKISKELKLLIAEKNQNYFLNNIFFNKDFMDFYLNTLSNAIRTFYLKDDENRLEILKMHIAFFLNIVLRARDKTVFEKQFREVKSNLIMVNEKHLFYGFMLKIN